MTRRSPLLALALVAALVLTVLGVDWLVPPVEPEEPAAAPSSVTPVSGAWVCAVGDAMADEAATVTIAHPGGTGSPPAQLSVASFQDGVATVDSLLPLFAGSVASVVPETSDGVSITWRDAAVATTREWEIAAEDGDAALPAGTVAGPCVDAVSPRWIVPGLGTVGGQEARLNLANPFSTDATVAIGFLTPNGAEAPLALRNLTVPARDTVEVVVNDHLPEQPDLSAIVEVATGRVAVEGLQIARAAIGDVDGVSLLAAAPEAAETWTVPWVSDEDGIASWLWVSNPGDRTAPVELSLHTTTGGELPVGLTEVSVPPGTIRRVDLRGTLPEGVASAAITARSDGAPVVVSAASEVATGEAPDGTGLSVTLGAPATDGAWVVSGRDISGRQEALHLANPGSEPSTVDVRVFSGSTLAEPADLQGLTLAAGAAVTIDLAEVVSSGAWTAFVSASDGGVVAGRVGRAEEGPLGLVATLGVPAAAWSAVSEPLAGLADGALVVRLGTSLGLQVSAPFGDVGDEDPSVPAGEDRDPGQSDSDAPDPELPDPDAPDSDAPAEGEDAGIG
jgi:hypothetical protein